MDDPTGTIRPGDASQDCAVDAPLTVAADERRLHLRAYIHWTSLLNGRALPTIGDLDPAQLGDFGRNGVVLDFTADRHDPAIRFLGPRLVEESGEDRAIASVRAVPPGSLLSQLTDRYPEMLARRAPLTFDGEFVSRRGLDTLCRGILLPFSCGDGGTEIDFVFGVINWKEFAESAITEALVRELRQNLRGQNLRGTPAPERARSPWAEAPVAPPGPRPDR